MTSFDDFTMEITPQLLLKAYSCGIFPMAESAEESAIFWISPEERGVLPLDAFHVPRRLKRIVRREPFEIRIDCDYDGVIEGCAGPRPGRETTWINGRIRRLYRELFQLGHCHTVEAWRDGRLVGGLYGVHLGGAFFGESMFSYEDNASKVALVHLAARLIAGGFRLLDTQFVTDHLRQFGIRKVPRDDFQTLLEAALAERGDFAALGPSLSGAEALEIIARHAG